MTVDVVKGQGTLSPTMVTFAVSDPEVLLALSEYAEGSEKTQFLTTALKVGVLALKAAKGTLDSDTVRREGDHLMSELGNRLNTWRAGFEERVTGSLARYFDPKDGLFMERVDRLTRADGELTGVQNGLRSTDYDTRTSWIENLLVEDEFCDRSVGTADFVRATNLVHEVLVKDFGANAIPSDSIRTAPWNKETMRAALLSHVSYLRDCTEDETFSERLDQIIATNSRAQIDPGCFAGVRLALAVLAEEFDVLHPEERTGSERPR